MFKNNLVEKIGPSIFTFEENLTIYAMKNLMIADYDRRSKLFQTCCRSKFAYSELKRNLIMSAKDVVDQFRTFHVHVWKKINQTYQ